MKTVCSMTAIIDSTLIPIPNKSLLLFQRTHKDSPHFWWQMVPVTRVLFVCVIRSVRAFSVAVHMMSNRVKWWVVSIGVRSIFAHAVVAGHISNYLVCLSVAFGWRRKKELFREKCLNGKGMCFRSSSADRFTGLPKCMSNMPVQYRSVASSGIVFTAALHVEL